MNFEDVFPEVMKHGGFDAVVGNPPYVRQEGLGDEKDISRRSTRPLKVQQTSTHISLKRR